MSGGTAGTFSELLLGLCAGALFAMAAAMLRAPRPAARWTGFAFFFSSAVFAIKLWCDSTEAFPFEIRVVISLIAMTSVGWFWLMVMALFEDVDEFRPIMFAAPAGLLLFGIANHFPRTPLSPVIWTGSTLLQAGLAIAALVMVLRSWKGDLVESRRQIRGPFMIAVSLYILSLNGFDIWEMIGDTPAWYPMFNAALLTLCVLAGAFAFLEARGAMFGETAQAPALPRVAPARASVVAGVHANGANGSPGLNGGSAALDRAAKADLGRLELLMSTQQVWKEEGLTIAGLAIRAGVPEIATAPPDQRPARLSELPFLCERPPNLRRQDAALRSQRSARFHLRHRLRHRLCLARPVQPRVSRGNRRCALGMAAQRPP